MDHDSGFIERFNSGDLEGFKMLVKKYQNTALNIAYSFTLNTTDAQDIAQEAFLKVYHNLKGFRGESKFSSWLYRIVANCAYDFLRKNKRNVISLDELPAYAEISAPENREDPLLKNLFKWALLKIPLEYRSVLVLRELEGLSYQDISRALKINIGTVESRLSRARSALKEVLLKKGVLKNEV
jgi:RNA polymerase sigma-70 factor (ECF subfamily)